MARPLRRSAKQPGAQGRLNLGASRDILCKRAVDQHVAVDRQRPEYLGADLAGDWVDCVADALPELSTDVLTVVELSHCQS